MVWYSFIYIKKINNSVFHRGILYKQWCWEERENLKEDKAVLSFEAILRVILPTFLWIKQMIVFFIKILKRCWTFDEGIVIVFYFLFFTKFMIDKMINPNTLRTIPTNHLSLNYTKYKLFKTPRVLENHIIF